MNQKIKNVLQLLLAAGATIENFSIFTAHVTATGGNYTEIGELWLHANGAFLPVICTMVYLLCYKKNSKNSFYHFFSFVVALFPVGSMLAWVFIPFLYINGNAPVSDDVTHFLNIFSKYYHPLFVSVMAVVIIGISIAVMVKKGIFSNVIPKSKRIRNQTQQE